MPPLAKDQNSVGPSPNNVKQGKQSKALPGLLKDKNSSKIQSTNASEVARSWSLKNKLSKSSQPPCVNCKKKLIVDSAGNQKPALKRYHSGTYYKFGRGRPQFEICRKLISPKPRPDDSKDDQGICALSPKLNSTFQKTVFSSDQTDYVDVVALIEKEDFPIDQKEKSESTNKAGRPSCSTEVLPAATQASPAPPNTQDGTQSSHLLISQAKTSSNTTGEHQKQSLGIGQFLLPQTCAEQKCKCPADQKLGNDSLFRSTLMYNDCCDAASSRVVILASCVSEYIKAVFQQLDYQSRGSITVKEFECLCKVLGISSSLSQSNKRQSWLNTDGRIELPGFEKLIWECMTSENQKLPVSLEERRFSVALANSVLNISKNVQSLENITDDLRGISKSIASNEKLTRRASDETLTVSKENKFFEKHEVCLDSLKDFSKSSFVCYEENKRMKSIIEDLRKALQASDAENLALKVKLEMFAESEHGREGTFIDGSQHAHPMRLRSKSSPLNRRSRSQDSAYSSEQSKESTPLWTRKSAFFNNLMSYHGIHDERDTDCSSSPPISNISSENEVRGKVEAPVSINSSSSSEAGYLCMEVINRIASGMNFPGIETETIYSDVVGDTATFDNNLKFPVPSPRRSKNKKIGYCPNRTRLHRSGYTRGSLRIYQNVQLPAPPTPPSVKSIPKWHSVGNFTATEVNGLSTSSNRIDQQGKLTVVDSSNRLSITEPDDEVQLRREVNSESYSFRRGRRGTYTKGENSALAQSVGTNNASVARLSQNASSESRLPRLLSGRQTSMNADELSPKQKSTVTYSVPKSIPIYKPADLLQASRPTTPDSNLGTTSNSLCPVSEQTGRILNTADNEATLAGIPAAQLTPSWHVTLRNSPGCVAQSEPPQPHRSGTPNARRFRSQPLPQLLATRAMLEATLNAVLLNNRLIADHGVRSFKPEVLRSKLSSDDDIASSFRNSAETQSDPSTFSPAIHMRECGSFSKSEAIHKIEEEKLPTIPDEDMNKNNTKIDIYPALVKNRVPIHTKGRMSAEERIINSNLSKKVEKFVMPSIQESAEERFNASKISTLPTLNSTYGPPDKTSSVPSSVDELLAEMVEYCKDNYVNISNNSLRAKSSISGVSARVCGGNSGKKNADGPASQSCDLATGTCRNSTQIKEATNSIKSYARCESSPEKLPLTKNSPSEEIYISSSGSDDSGRGDSEGSCPSPEDLSGGSDDGLWTPYDDPPSTSVAYDCTRCTCFDDRSTLQCYFHSAKYCAHVEKVNQINQFKTDKPYFEQNCIQCDVSRVQKPDLCNDCKKSTNACDCFKENVSLVQCTAMFSYGSRNSGNTELKTTKELAHCVDDSDHCIIESAQNKYTLQKEAYDNIEPLLPSKGSSKSYDTGIQIISLDEDSRFGRTEQSKGEKESTGKAVQKHKGFLGRRCTSFNTFRSFLSNTASQFKRNTSGRLSLSLPRSYLKATDDLAIGMTEREPPRSIVKRPLKDCNDEKKKKRISFKDTVDIFTIKSQGRATNLGETQSLRCEKESSGAAEFLPSENVDEFKLRTSSSIKNDPNAILMNNATTHHGVLKNMYGNSAQALTSLENIKEQQMTVLDYGWNTVQNLCPLPNPETEFLDEAFATQGPNAVDTKSVTDGSFSTTLSMEENCETSCIPESRALLEALEDDLEVILKALAEDESKIQ